MRKTLLSILLCVFIATGISAQTTAFSYQGSLKDGASAANGNYDFQFALYDAVSGGNQLGSTLTRNSVAVATGIFSVSLDFGSQFPGANRFLEIRVRLTGQPSLTTLTPRQQINSQPYSVKSLGADTATTATNATQLGGVAASQYVVTTDPRMTDSRSPTAGSTNYVQNGTSPQSSSNFNVSGTGTANILNSTTQFNLNGNRILSAPASNLFVGPQTGQSNTTGNSNSFFGSSAGANNSSGGNNSFFGYFAGNTTNTGSGNAFFGYQAGRSNTTGGVNSYFGFNAGEFSTTANYNSFFGFNAGNKTTAEDNSFFGAAAGQNTTTGYQNSFFGRQAGSTNTTGFQNSFFGRNAGLSNTAGDNNSFFGTAAGELNTSGVQNSFFGGFAGEFNTTGSANSFFGFVAGLQNTTGTRNSIFGFDAGRLNQAGNDNASFGHSAGRNTLGSNNSFFGAAAGTLTADGDSNSFFGRNAGVSNTSGDENSFYGAAAGGFNTTGIRNTAIGYNANPGAGNLQYATAIGADSTVSTSNTIALGRSNGSDQVVIPGALVANLPAGDTDYIQNRTTLQAASNFNVSGNGYVAGNVGIGTTTPSDKLQVNGGITANGVTASSLSSTSGLFLNSATGSRIALRTSGGSTERMTILDNGNVGIGITNPTSNFQVGNYFVVSSSAVKLPLSQTGSVGHVCYDNISLVLSVCFSSAEYAPSIDNGAGFPETADLVSIATAVKNPYGDAHGPFTVEKSSTACDANLLGFITNPEKGANGPKLNDHYLPLSIYGYFPAKVTLENGPIKRGDPITSSSKAGYGMKSIKACKIIGYALEDADEEGTIQVFANLSEYSAPVVAELQSQIENLKKEKSTEVEELKARLAALEQIVLSAEKSKK
ncbi:MAG: hypothetical protein IPL32_12430 [Chloracidobacterium sp.]|nr:hypothetical protein [Chloracidobacterium sp.]